jgi:pyruvate formate lyase activating enzyme
MERHTACAVCGGTHPLMSEVLGICPDCAHSEASVDHAHVVHSASRRLFDLPETPPRTEAGIKCTLCGCECVIGESERGFCGLRTVREGRLRHLAGTPQRGRLHWYRDPLPTNCVADWVCTGSQQRGKHNLAVFYNSCTINCLFCQNWHFREVDIERSGGLSARQLADTANSQTYCVCYFGGDPASQVPHALASAKALAKQGVIVCWETAGTSHPKLLDRAVRLSLETGGCIKFDLKAYTESLHIALTGWSNQRTLANFARAAERLHERPHPPLVVASTLLVPGYVDVSEVGRIATFIADQSPNIPYALLGFAPNFLMPDLPVTSVRHAEAARQAALEAGLRNVRIANRHLLGHDY